MPGRKTLDNNLKVKCAHIYTQLQVCVSFGAIQRPRARSVICCPLVFMFIKHDKVKHCWYWLLYFYFSILIHLKMCCAFKLCCVCVKPAVVKTKFPLCGINEI